MKRRILAWLVVLCMTLTLIPMGLAESNETTDTEECCTHEHCEQEACEHDHCEHCEQEACEHDHCEHCEQEACEHDHCEHEKCTYEHCACEHDHTAHTQAGAEHPDAQTPDDSPYEITYTDRDETKEEPAEEPTEELVEEPAAEPVEEPAEEPAEEPVEEPAEEPVEEGKKPVSPKKNGSETFSDDPLSVGTTTFEITQNGQTVYRPFTPENTGSYRFFSTGDDDTFGYLLNGEKEKLAENDDSGEEYNFHIFYELTAGETYWLGVRFLEDEFTGSVSVTVVDLTNCTHPNAEKHVYSTEDCDYTEIPGDDVYHTISGTYSVRYHCPDCDLWFGDSMETGSTQQKHNYGLNTGNCENCGHNCSHTDLDLAQYDQNNTYEEIEGDNKYHTVYCEEVAVYYCGSCGYEDILREPTGYTWTNTESHSYQYNEETDQYVCYYCGYVNTCAHANTHQVVSSDEEDCSYTELPDDDTYHTINGRYWVATYCDDCGARLEITEENGTAQEKHVYDGSSCMLCNHHCAHSHLFACDSNYQYTYEEIEDDNRNHITHEIEVYVYGCSDCGKWGVKEEPSGYEQSWHGEHSYQYNEETDQYVCCDCGHVNTCEHPITGQSWYWKNWEDIEYTDTGSNLTHLQSGVRVNFTYCDECGARLHEDGEELYCRENDHEYNGNGVCNLCGHVNTCTHENVYDDWWYYAGEVTCTDIGSDTEHEVTGEAHHTQICSDCGMCLSEYSQQETWTEAHRFNENGVCYLCGHVNACEHVNIADNWYWEDWDSCTFEEIEGDNRYHLLTGIQIQYSYCKDCGQRFNEQRIEASVQDWHSYDENGVCYDCGHVNTCEHPITGQSWYWKNWEDIEYTDTGSNLTHLESGVRVNFTYCVECGARLHEDGEELYSRENDHEYNGNGVCRRCGHVNTCTHGTTRVDGWYWRDWDWDEVPYEDTGDNHYHVASGVRVVVLCCAECGQWMGEFEEEYTAYDEHRYDENGVCYLCGHVNACEHVNIADNWYWEDWDSCTFEEIEGDNRYHLLTGIQIQYSYCKDCGQRFNEQRTEASEQDWHSYDENGVCYDCGHVNTCEHVNIEDDWYWEDWDSCTFEEIEGDNRYHLLTGIQIQYSYCEDCGQRFNEQRTEASEQDWHSYDENGVCYDCGHVNTCTHPITGQSWYWKNWEDIEYTDTGSNLTHLESGVRVNFTYCVECGARLHEDGEQPYSREVDHSYNENGVCYDCGHVNTCTHETLYDSWRPYDWEISSYEDLGGNRVHRAIGKRTVYTLCAGCGKQMSSRTEDYSEIQFHSFNDQGVCEYCGHKNVCEHLHINTYTSAQWDTLTYQDNGSDRYHTVTGKGYRYTYCEDCGTVLESTSIDDYSSEQIHNYDPNSGICYDCGHVNACRHEDTYESKYWEYGSTFYTDTGDNMSHTVRGIRVTCIECSDCCMMLGSQTELTTGEENHDYRDGYCYDCGHKNTCTHEHTHWDGWFETVSEITYDTVSHTTTGEGFHKYGYCEDCSETWNMGVYDEFTVIGKHRFAEGSDKCTYCGATVTAVGWQKSHDRWYYIYPQHVLARDWQKIDNTWYYFDSYYAWMMTGWQQINNVWYYFTSGGAMVTGWQKINNVWYYFKSGGSMVTGWQKISDKWYYFTSGGAMVTGWQKISNKWYYFASGGAMQTGWQKINDVWYYFQSGGQMVTGWQKISDKWYYFEGSGAMVTGWKKLGNTWYYFQSGGQMQTGWLKLNNKWYYFESSGAMVANTSKTISGKVYNFDANGVCLNP